jgi:hypothetical protein
MNNTVLKIENLTKIYKLGKRDVQPLANLYLNVTKASS